MHSHSSRELLEALTVCWEQWEARAATRAQKLARARLHLLFLLLRYGALRLGEALALAPRAAVDTVTGMLRVPGPQAREILLPLSAMRHMRRILSLPEAAGEDFLRFDQSFVRRKFYAVGRSMDLPTAVTGPRAIRYWRGLELLELHVPMPLVQKFLGQQGAAQVKAFLDFFHGEARRILAARALELARSGGGPEESVNEFLGVVSQVRMGLRKVRVEITTFSDICLVAACSPEEAALLEAHEGQVLSARVDPERLALAPEKALLGLGNCVRGTVESVHADLVESFVCVGLADGTRLRAVLETGALNAARLREGKKVFVYFGADAVRLSAD